MSILDRINTETEEGILETIRILGEETGRLQRMLGWADKAMVELIRKDKGTVVEEYAFGAFRIADAMEREYQKRLKKQE